MRTTEKSETAKKQRRLLPNGADGQRLAHTLKERLGEGREAASDRLGSMTRAAQKKIGHLGGQRHSALANYLSSPGSVIKGATLLFGSRGARSLLQRAGRLTRRNPALLIAGGIGAGMLLAHCIRSSRKRSAGDHQDESRHADWGATAAPRHSGEGELEDRINKEFADGPREDTDTPRGSNT